MGYLGQADTPSISFAQDGTSMSWYVPPAFPDPIELYVVGEDGQRTPHVGGRGGSTAVNFIGPGRRLRWDMLSNGVLILAVEVDATAGLPLRQWTVFSQPISGGGGGEVPPPPGPSPTGGSWFDQSTVLFGVSIPNLYLVAGAGILGLAALKGRK